MQFDIMNRFHALPGIIFKHIVVGGIFFYGVALWIKAHKMIKKIRNELAVIR